MVGSLVSDPEPETPGPELGVDTSYREGWDGVGQSEQKLGFMGKETRDTIRQECDDIL